MSRLPNGDAVPELEPVDTQHLELSDWEHLRRLRDLVANRADHDRAVAVIDEIGRGPRNGMVVAIEADVKGLYGITPSSQYRYVPKDEFAELDADRLRELVLARIDALRPGRCEVPESVFRVDIFAIEFEGEPIRVREIARAEWDYILFVAADDPSTHFVEIVHGSHAMYTVVKRLDPDDSHRLTTGAIEGPDLDRLVDRYR